MTRYAGELTPAMFRDHLADQSAKNNKDDQVDRSLPTRCIATSQSLTDF